MGDTGLRGTRSSAWDLVARQHGVIARRQLLERGFSAKEIAHRIAVGRLHRVRRGVYAAGRPGLTREGQWMAAVLACGPEVLLSHGSAAALWGMRPDKGGRVDVSVPDRVVRHSPGIAVHRRVRLEASTHRDIPVTPPVGTLIDLAGVISARQLEAAVNEADKLGLVDLDELRAAVTRGSARRGAPALRAVLDRHTFTLTDSELERRFLPLVRAAGLPLPQSGRRLNGFKVDFFWPDLALIVETDGLRYHRTPAQQAGDRRRDQRHTAAGFTPLRFTHAQITYEPHEVKATLGAVAKRLSEAPYPS